MGAWDVGPFDNDPAGGLLDELESVGTDRIPVVLSEKFRALIDSAEELDNWDVCEVVAGAALVAHRLSGEIEVSPYAEDFLDAHPFEVTDYLRALAKQSLLRVLKPESNEWYDLWVSSDGMDEVRTELEPFIRVLAGGRDA